MKNSVAYIKTIKRNMKKKKLSQGDLAKLLNTSQSTISQWLLGNKKPSYKNIVKICKLLDITPNEFFGY